jgi:hypothetical protein
LAPNATTALVGYDSSRPESSRQIQMPAPIVLVLTADFQVAATTVLANVPGMSVALPAGIFEIALSLHFNMTGGQSQGWRFALGVTGATFGSAQVMTGIATVSGAPALFAFNVGSNGGSTQAAATGTDDLVTAFGTIRLTAGGTLQLQFAQGTSNANATNLSAGSLLAATRLG